MKYVYGLRPTPMLPLFDRHRKLYGFATEELQEMVSIRTRAFGPRSRDRSASIHNQGAPTHERREEAFRVRSLPGTFVAGEKRMTPRQ